MLQRILYKVMAVAYALHPYSKQRVGITPNEYRKLNYNGVLIKSPETADWGDAVVRAENEVEWCGHQPAKHRVYQTGSPGGTGYM